MKNFFGKIITSLCVGALGILMFSATVFAANVTVTFVTAKGNYQVVVPQGYSAVYSGPTDINIPGYAFCGWDKSLLNVQQDTVVYAVYLPTGSEGESVDVCNVYHHLPTGILSYSTANEDTIPKETAESKFLPTVMDKPAALTAEQSIRLNPVGVPGKTCVVKWYNGSTGELWFTDVVPYGATLVQPADPCIDGLEFIGWEGSWTNVTTDRDIIACFYKEYHVHYLCGECGAELGDRHIRVNDPIDPKSNGISTYEHPDAKDWEYIYMDDGCTIYVISNFNPNKDYYLK